MRFPHKDGTKATARGYFQAPDGKWMHFTVEGMIVDKKFVQTSDPVIIHVPSSTKFIKQSSKKRPKYDLS